MNMWKILLLIILVLMTPLFVDAKNDEPIQVLILSGRSNHDWKSTSSLLEKELNESELFKVSVTNQPDTLRSKDFIKFKVIISNWNSYPDSRFRFSPKWEEDFRNFVSQGGGVLTFHAGGSSYNGIDWYHQITIGWWGKNTHHGKPTLGRIDSLDPNHPITRGIAPFMIFDELWDKAEIIPEAKSLGNLSVADPQEAGPQNTPAIFVSNYGKGRCCYLLMGHDNQALNNSSVQTLIKRALQWCAIDRVTVLPPAELQLRRKDSGSYPCK